MDIGIVALGVFLIVTSMAFWFTKAQAILIPAIMGAVAYFFTWTASVETAVDALILQPFDLMLAGVTLEPIHWAGIWLGTTFIILAVVLFFINGASQFAKNGKWRLVQ